MAVINPWLFYIIDLLDKLYVGVCIVFWGAALAIGGSFLCWAIESCYLSEKSILKIKKNNQIINRSINYFVSNVCRNSIKRYNVQNAGFKIRYI